MAFSFGLMHGPGFAGGLSEAGLPAGHIPSALLFPSLGVETGHFLFIGVVLAFTALIRHRAALRHAITPRMNGKTVIVHASSGMAGDHADRNSALFLPVGAASLFAR